MFQRFINKIAVISGGANGIGKAIACRLGKEGATVILFDVNKALLKKTIKEFTDENILAKGYDIDISDEEQLSKVIKKVITTFHKIDIMVNCAGIVGPTSTRITDYPTADFDKLYDVNLKGSFLITKLH